MFYFLCMTADFIFWIFFGLFFGSFATMVSYRLFYENFSHPLRPLPCHHCGHERKIWDAIPFFSWIFFRGKCAYCHHSLSLIHPATVIFSTGFFLWVWFSVAASASFGYQFFLLITAAFAMFLWTYDTWFMTVDRRISWPAIFFAIFMIWYLGHIPWADAISGALLGGGFYALQYGIPKIFLKKNPWVGLGDVELGIFMGLCLGFFHTLGALFLAYFLGFFYALPLLIFARAKRNTPLPMGAFLMPAFLIFLTAGDKIFHGYFSLFIF